MGWSAFVLIVTFIVARAKCDNIFDQAVQIVQPTPYYPLGPGDNLGDIYCAYCRKMGWIDCIRQWCFGGIAAVFPTPIIYDLTPAEWDTLGMLAMTQDIMELSYNTNIREVN